MKVIITSVHSIQLIPENDSDLAILGCLEYDTLDDNTLVKNEFNMISEKYKIVSIFRYENKEAFGDMNLAINFLKK